MTEQKAREAIVTWARNHFFENDIRPDVQVLTIQHNDDDEWEAKLVVSTSADNPHVTFFMDEQHGLQVSAVEY
jgi:AmiR/NasT family two-component response regulator